MSVLAFLAFGLRAFRLGRSWDIFVDEITYLRLSQNVANHLSVSLYGSHFYLHPPAFFFLQALYLKLVDPNGSVIVQVQSVRYVNTLVAAVSTALLFYIGYRIEGRLSGLIAALMFAFDPFVIRISSRNLLDPSAVMWVLLGYALLLSVDDLRREPAPRLIGVAAGLAFGMAFLTKDMTLFLTLVPLAICYVLDWSVSRPLARLTAVVTASCYLPYLLIVAAVGDTRPFLHQKFRGVLRLLGAIQETGFHRHGSPSFLSAIFAQLDTFATTYVIIALGLLAIWVLLMAGGEQRRLVAVWAGSAYVLLAYSVGFGTLEEQFFYYLVIPSIVAIAVASKTYYQTRANTFQHRQRIVLAGTWLTLVFVLWSGTVWWRIHTTPDNGFQRLETYLQQNVSGGSRIAVTTQTGQFVTTGYVTGIWVTPAELRQHHARYAIVSTSEIDKGYSFAGKDLLLWLRQNAQLEYSFHEPSFGSLRLYRLPLEPGSVVVPNR